MVQDTVGRASMFDGATLDFNPNSVSSNWAQSLIMSLDLLSSGYRDGSQVKVNQLISVLFSLTFLQCLVSAVCSKHPNGTEKADMTRIPACLNLEAGVEDLVFC